MERPSLGGAGGGPADLRRFRRLADITAATTLLLIVVGGVVRVSDSGLGCGPAGSGTHGWPLCGGRAVPLVETNTIVEFSHRLLATVVVVLIALLAWTAYRGLRERGWPLRGSIAAGVLVLMQAALGGLTVENNLAEELVAAHLALAMLLLGTILWLDLSARRGLAAAAHGRGAPRVGRLRGATSGAPRSGASGARGLLPLAIVAAVLLFGAIVAGGYIAGTEKEGAEGTPVVNGAHLACGEQFPRCLDRFLPFGESRLVDIQLTHRVLVYGATAAILALIGLAALRGWRSRLLLAALALLAVQLALGALNVWLGKHAVLVVAHLTIATLLWSTVLVIAMRLAWATQPASRSDPAEAEAAAAPA